MIVYRAQNLINGMIYIGQTTHSLIRRIRIHLCAKNGYFPRALKKYGIDNFVFEVIDICNSNKELDERERFWITYYKCIAPLGYNLALGGAGSNGTKGMKFTDEHREKISIAKKGKKFSNEHKDNLRKSAGHMKGKILGETHKERIAIAHRRLSKLVEFQIEAIRNDYRSQRCIAKDYGVSQTTIRRIKHYKVWNIRKPLEQMTRGAMGGLLA